MEGMTFSAAVFTTIVSALGLKSKAILPVIAGTSTQQGTHTLSGTIAALLCSISIPDMYKICTFQFGRYNFSGTVSTCASYEGSYTFNGAKSALSCRIAMHLVGHFQHTSANVLKLVEPYLHFSAELPY